MVETRYFSNPSIKCSVTSLFCAQEGKKYIFIANGIKGQFSGTDDCCLSVDDVLYVVYCFVTHPTFLSIDSILAVHATIQVLAHNLEFNC